MLPWLGLLFACQPNIGLAILAGYPRPLVLIGAASLTLVGPLLWPSWFTDWRAALQGAPNAVSLVTLPGGVVMLAALARWRHAEARLLVALACVPHTTLPYEALPLFLIPRSFTEAWILWAGTALALVGHAWGEPYASQLEWVRAAGKWSLYCAYLPCLLFVLRRPASSGSTRTAAVPKANGAAPTS